MSNDIGCLGAEAPKSPDTKSATPTAAESPGSTASKTFTSLLLEKFGNILLNVEMPLSADLKKELPEFTIDCPILAKLCLPSELFPVASNPCTAVPFNWKERLAVEINLASKTSCDG